MPIKLKFSYFLGEKNQFSVRAAEVVHESLNERFTTVLQPVMNRPVCINTLPKN